MKRFFYQIYIKFIRPLIVIVYYKYPFGWWCRALLTYCRIRLNKNSIAISELKKLISDAKKQGKPLFVQFPIIDWETSLFQRPQQFSLAMHKLGYFTIFINPYPKKPSIQKISEDFYVTDQHDILKDLSGAIISLYRNR